MPGNYLRPNSGSPIMSTKSLPRCLSDWPIPVEFYAKPKPWLEVIVVAAGPLARSYIDKPYRLWLSRAQFQVHVASRSVSLIILREVDQKP